MKNITIVVPVHKINDSILEMVNNSVSSIVDAINKLENETDFVPVMFVGDKEVTEKLKEGVNVKFDRIKFEYTINEGSTDFCSQINRAVDEIKTEYFSILEFDDMYTPNFLLNFNIYSDEYKKTSAFLPINEMYNEEGNFVGYANEIVWTQYFNENNEERGEITNETLKMFMDFNATGGIFKVKDFVEVGKLKTNIKLSFWYEFLLRMTFLGKNIKVIPKIGYCHILNREDSLMKLNTDTISAKEGSHWIKTAQQEYFFKEERPIKEYTEEMDSKV